MGSVLPVNGSVDFLSYDNRLRSIETEVNKMKNLESTVRTLQSELSLLKKSSNGQAGPNVQSLTLPIYEKLKQHIPSISRDRSESIASSKRARSTNDSNDELSSDAESVFQLPKKQIKKNARNEKKRKLSAGGPTFSDIAKKIPPNVGSKPKGKYRPAIWGKAENVQSDSSISGAVPEVFMFNFAQHVNENAVKDYLKSQNINSTHVKLVSHKDARKRSFKVSLASYRDYDSLKSGEKLPRGVGVRNFYYPRSTDKTPGELGALATSDSYVSTFTGKTQVEWGCAANISQQVEDFINQSNDELATLSSQNNNILISSQMDASRSTASQDQTNTSLWLVYLHKLIKICPQYRITVPYNGAK